MKWKDIKDKGKSDLEELQVEKRFELQTLRFQAHGQQLKQVHKINSLRRLIARLEMLLKNK